MKLRSLIISAAATAALAAAAYEPALAMPAYPLAVAQPALQIETVAYRRARPVRRAQVRRRYNNAGPAAVLGAMAGIIGAGVAASQQQQYYEAPSYYPAYGQPAYGYPAYEGPGYAYPAYGAPAYGYSGYGYTRRPVRNDYNPW